MSPERARVLVVENEEMWQEIIKDALQGSGHQVVLTATSLEEALEAIERVKELGIQVATIDANLHEGIHNGLDGKFFLETIREVAPKVKTIGLSSAKIEGVDVNLGKENCLDLADTITKI